MREKILNVPDFIQLIIVDNRKKFKIELITYIQKKINGKNISS